MNIRKLAMAAIEKILFKGGYCNIVINEYLNKFEFSDEDRRLFTRLVLGTIEYRITLSYYLEPYIRKKQKNWVNIILLMSVYQLVYMNIPDYAVVNEAVILVNMNDRNVASFVNAVLRNFLRNPIRTFDGLDEVQRLSIEYSYPSWLVAYLLKDYDYDTILQIFKFNSEVKNTAIRINTLKATKEEIEAILLEERIPFYRSELVSSGLVVAEPLMSHEIFLSGKVTIQDIASQMVVEVAKPKKNSLIIDLCSAPGGKCSHMAAMMNNTGKIYACDIHNHKIKLMEKNFKRLGVTNVVPQLIDAREVGKVVKEESFEYVFADLPCSGLGVLSHKIDLKYNITYEAILEIIKLQKEILDSGYKLLKNNGHLIISTCTINKSENELQTKTLIEKYPNLKIEYEKTILPYEHDTDGFYICILKKHEANNE